MAGFDDKIMLVCLPAKSFTICAAKAEKQASTKKIFTYKPFVLQGL